MAALAIATASAIVVGHVLIVPLLPYEDGGVSISCCSCCSGRHEHGEPPDPVAIRIRNHEGALKRCAKLTYDRIEVIVHGEGGRTVASARGPDLAVATCVREVVEQIGFPDNVGFMLSIDLSARWMEIRR